MDEMMMVELSYINEYGTTELYKLLLFCGVLAN